jgi:hypothetical protein
MGIGRDLAELICGVPTPPPPGSVHLASAGYTRPDKLLILPSMRYKAPNSPPNSQTALSLCCHTIDAPDALRGAYSADLAYRPLTAKASERRPAPSIA